MPRLINHRHELFAQHMASGMSQVAAFEAAGYAAEHNGNMARLANRPHVRARINELIDKAATKAEITAERIMVELGKIAFVNMGDFLRVDDDGDAYLDFSELTEDQAAAISEIVVEDFKDGRGEDARDVRRVRFKLADKQGALEKLGKILGMFTTKVQHSGSVVHEHQMTADQARAKIARFLEGERQKQGDVALTKH